MKSIKELIEIIKQLRSKYNLLIPNPATEEAIKTFSGKFNAKFRIVPPKEYLNFLLICDGLEENGCKIYSSIDHEKNGVAYGLFELNEIWHEQDPGFSKYIYYGDSDQDLYVYDTETRKYQVLDKYCGDEMESFTSFDKMLVYILNRMIG